MFWLFYEFILDLFFLPVKQLLVCHSFSYRIYHVLVLFLLLEAKQKISLTDVS